MRKFLVRSLSTLFATGGLLAAWLVVPLDLVSASFREVVSTVVFCLAGLMLSVLAVDKAFERRAAKRAIVTTEEGGELVAGLIGTIVGCWVVTGWICGAAGGAYRTFLWAIDPATGRFPALVLCLPLTFVAGLVLFWIRLRLRSVYGFTEVAVGLVVALWQVVTASPERPLLDFGPMVGFLTAGVYVVVRGMDNMHVGWKAEKPDPLVRLLKRWIRPAPSFEAQAIEAGDDDAGG